MKICLCVGTRPNFMKAASLIRAFKKYNLEYQLIHTGQHYDKNMSEIFFGELGIPEPDINLGSWVDGDSSSEQIGRTMIYFSRQIELNRPDLIMVLGDVHSTLACALVANKMGIPLAHVEAGERSRDRSMQEEINRVLVDEMSDFLFCASEEAYNNLRKTTPNRDGVKTFLVGDAMVDQLVYSLPKIGRAVDSAEPYALLTIHRAGNVDNRERLEAIIEIVSKVSEKIQVFFPCHPRTRKAIQAFIFRGKGIADYTFLNIIMINPMSYLEFMTLVKNAKLVITDSGGLQVETSYLNIPCLTLRENTERHDTITSGTNTMISIDKYIKGCDIPIFNNVDMILKGQWRQSSFKSNPIHDGKAAERIVKILKKETNLWV